MGFFDNIGSFFGGLFGGQSEEEKRRKQQQQQQATPGPRPQAPQAPQAQTSNSLYPQPNELQQSPMRQPDKGINLVLPETLQKASSGNANQDATRQRLAELTQSNAGQAQKDAEQGSNWLDRNFLRKGAIQDQAKVLARTRATSQFQNENGWVKDPTVLKYGSETNNLASQNSLRIQQEGKNLDNISHAADKVGEFLQPIPIVGSLMNLGNLGVEKLQKAAGDTAGAQATKNTRNRIEFGMDQNQWDSMTQEQRSKYELLRNIGYALTPLDFTGLGGLTKSEGLALTKDAAKQLLKKEAIDEVTKQGLKDVAKTEAKKAITATVVGTGVNAGAQQYLTGEVDPIEAAKGGLMIGGSSLLVPEAGKESGIKSIDHIKTGSDARNAATNVDVPEIAPGVKSANRNREVDIARAREAQAAKQAEDVRLRQAAEEAGSGAKTAVKNAAEQLPDAPITPHTITPKESTILTQLDSAAKERVLTPDEANIRQALTNKQAVIAEANNPTPVAPKAEPVAPAPQSAKSAPVDPTAPVNAQNDQVVYDARGSAVPTNQAIGNDLASPELQTSGEIPRLADPETGKMVDVAPRYHDEMVKQMGDSTDAKKGLFSKRPEVNLEDLRTKAEGVVANMDDTSIMKAFQSVSPDEMVKDTNSFAVARAARDRLSRIPNDPVAAQTVSNIMTAMEHKASGSATLMRVMQEDFDNLPMPAKVNYIIKKIDAANIDTPGYSTLKGDPALGAKVEADITHFLQKSQNISEDISALKGKLEMVTDAARRGENTGVDVPALVRDLTNKERSLSAQNGELAKYFNEQMPKAGKGKRANDFARRMMLASFTGRINDLATTGANIIHQGLEDTTQGVLNKVVNLVKGKGTVTDTLAGNKQFLQGTAEGARRTAGEFKGTQYAGDVKSALQHNVDARSGLKKANTRGARIIQAGTEAATNLSEGVRTKRLYQLAKQEADQLDIPKDLVDTYATARAASPTRDMEVKAQRLKAEVNNLQDNAISRGLNKTAAAIESSHPAFGGFIKNQIVPFTSWLGGNIHNTVTDKNVVANSVKIIKAARNGDIEGVTRNLAKLTNNTAVMAAGYYLTQQGLLTTKDAQGYSDAGVYIHVGDRYIPAGFLGFFAPSLIMGNATYTGINSEDGGSPSERVAQVLSDSLTNTARSTNMESALGADNNLTRSIDAGLRPGGNAGDSASVFTSGAAGQFIPGFSGDINAVLDNNSPLNPTHEKADTKVVDPNSKSGTAKDVPASSVASLVNRIPIASQTLLPRKENVAAKDLFDRVTKGNRDTPGGIETKAKAQAVTDQKKDFEKRGVPMTQAGIDANFQNGNFDKAIEGTKYRMAEAEKKGELSKSDRTRFEKQIRLSETMKNERISYEDYDAYNKTGVADWRKYGNPKAEEYNPELFQKLNAIDQVLASANASDNSKASDKPKFSTAKASGGGGSSKNSALSKAKSNTVGSAIALSKVSYGDLKPEKAGSVKIPTIATVKPGQLIKKRAISVKRG